LRKPSGNSGRIERSISLQVRISESVMRPSRRLKLPGIRPPAAIFSRYSTTSGKKSTPGRGSREAVTVTRTTLSSSRTSTAAFACFAMRPVSSVTVRDPSRSSQVEGRGPGTVFFVSFMGAR
jgi:hypothetical protein